MFDRRLDHVVAVAHHGSITRAAEQVGITQSGMTKSIADLERELGYPLFYRTARGVLQTEAGRDFVERAGRLLDDARALITGEQERTDPYAQSLRIGICPASLEWLLAEPLAGLLARHPALRFELVGTTFERGIQLLRTGAVDVAIGFEDAFSEWSEVRREQIGALRAKPFVRKDHPILTIKAPTCSDLTRYQFVIPSDSRPYGKTIRTMFEAAGIMDWRRHVHVVDYFPVVKKLVRTSDAIGVAADSFASSDSFADAFVSVTGKSPFLPAPMCCAFRSRWEPSPAVRAFLAAMRSQAR